MKRKNRILWISIIAVVMTCNVMSVCGSLMGCADEEIVFEQSASDSGKDVTATTSEEEMQGEVSYYEKSPDKKSFDEKQTDESAAINGADSVSGGAVPEGGAEYESQVQNVSKCYVDVCGAVLNPGVYEVLEGARVYEVLLLAGGVTSEAETACVNQAIAVYDGLKLIVPTKEEWVAGKYAVNENEFVVRKEEMQKGSSHNEGAASHADDGLININTATAEELCTLPGVGNAKAESIIAHREEFGPFENIEDIKNVAGIKEGLFEKIKSKIKV